MNNRITLSKIKKYYILSSEALLLAKKSIRSQKIKDAESIFRMVEAYLSDSQYFLKKGDYVNAFGALNYAHGWLDCGARLKIFIVSDDRFFTI